MNKIIRENLLTEKGHTPYCGADHYIGRWPRLVFDGSQFVCPSCGWTSQFDDELIIEYKAKWSK